MVATANVGAVLSAARQAQPAWAAQEVATRLRFVRKLRDLLATEARPILTAFPASLGRKPSESLTSEIIPLAEACRFLELQATPLLRAKRLSRRGRPFWLGKVSIEVQRDPHGVVLVIGPANYPLFLPGVQAIQALVAGNAVIVKPGIGGASVMQALGKLMHRAGLPSALFAVLDESTEAAQDAIALGVDKIFVTGSLHSGRAVLRAAAEHVVPVTAELSGMDPVIVLASADVERAEHAIRFGTQLNRGQTCIAPQRLLVHRSVATRFKHDLPVTTFDTVQEAVGQANDNRYALGATVFGEEAEARKVAGLLHCGVVVVNDMIVPTADPRLAFGGRKQSGFGKTRGADGLLEMTIAKAVIVQGAKRLRHLESLPANADDFFLSALEATHRSGLKNRLQGWTRLCKIAAAKWAKQ